MTSNDDWTNQAQNLVIVVGSNGGVFVYDPAPALGNLIASLTDAPADPFGNVTEKGVSAYVTDLNNIREAVSLNVGSIIGLAGLSIQDTVHPPAGAPGCYGVGSGAAGQSRAVAALDSGIVTVGDSDAVVTVQSQTDSAFTAGVISLSSGRVDIGNTPVLKADDNAGTLLANLPAGFFYLATASTDASSHSAGNNGSAADITKTWTVAGGDAKGTVYTIRAHVKVNTGQTTIETLTLGADLNGGTLVPLATLGTAFNGGALNTSYDIPVWLTLVVDAVSAGTPEITLSGGLGDLSANRLSTNSANMPGHSDGSAWNPAVSQTIALYAQWGGAGGSAQTAGTLWSVFSREGP